MSKAYAVVVKKEVQKDLEGRLTVVKEEPLRCPFDGAVMKEDKAVAELLTSSFEAIAYVCEKCGFIAYFRKR